MNKTRVYAGFPGVRIKVQVEDKCKSTDVTVTSPVIDNKIHLLELSKAA